MELIDEIKLINGKARISITIDSMGKVTLKHSKDVSKKALENFIENKSSWIEKKKSEKLKSLEINSKILNYEEIEILGTKYTLIKSKRNRVEENKIFYTTHKYLSNLIKKIAQCEFEEKVQFYSKIINVVPSKILLDNTKTRWGVCTSKNEIKINFRALLLPYELFEYIIIHELCHLIQFNHSNLYWQVVEKFCPNYKKCKQNIKEYSFLLSLFR
ncbi:MAG: M48 family metallopeptidase [Clostridia bacterium]|nr:M48 family metallopeptidase [Clostridia bacterium]